MAVPGKAIPCHLVTGPLGVGKTTAVIDYLQRQAGQQFVAFLVNDFGPVGLDAAIVEGEVGQQVKDATRVMMVPGGCICCTAAPSLIATFRELAASPQVDRIIVEPSGLAMAGDMVDLLRSLAESCRLDVRPVITLIDPQAIDRPSFQKTPFYQRMVEAADVLVANRCDLAPPEKVARFHEWAAALYPPKLRVVATDHGRLPDEVFELRIAGQRGAKLGAHHHEAHGHTHPQRDGPGHGVEAGRAGGLTLDADVRFGCSALEDALRRMAADGFAGRRVARLKGIFNTDFGWKLLEIAQGDVFSRATDYRRDNRVDWIAEEGAIVADDLRAHLLALRQDSDEGALIDNGC